MTRKRILAMLLACCLLAFCFAGCGKQEPPPEEPTQAPATPSPTPAQTVPPVTPPPAPTPIAFPAMGYVNAEGVNIRASASKNADVVDIMGENAQLELVAREGDWYRINLNGETAYVADHLVTIGDPPRKHNMHWAKVSAKEAQLYKSPSDTDLSDVKLKQGEYIKVLRKMDIYLHVVYGGNLQRYIKESDVEYVSEAEFLGLEGSPAPSASPKAE